MKILIVGIRVHGTKRKKLLKNKKVLTVDLNNKLADYRHIEEVPVKSFDVAFLCVPEQGKISINKILRTK